MDLKGIQLLFLFFAFLCTQVRKLNGDSISGCIPIERNALLGFQKGLKDPTNRLSSWVGDDCCIWEGVVCDNWTGHVVKLDLRNPHPFSDDDDLPYNKWSLGGELRPSLLGLKHLNYLDLSMNYFGGIRIPEFMGSFRELKYLNLSYAGLIGLIPHQLGNLSSLQYLDLQDNFYFLNKFGVHDHVLSIDNALWISHLSSLRFLNMTGVKFREGAHWLQALNMLPSIIEVRLSDCQINTTSLSLPHVNFSSLSVLDLSDNFINSTLPSWLFNISSLEHLDLSYNFIWGIIPPAIKNLASLSVLDLSDNFINSTVPDWLFNICSLEYLDLSGNIFRGIIPPAIKNLVSLKFFDLSYNRFLDGKIPAEPGGLCKLQYLGLSGINISKNLYELDEVFTGCIKNSLETLYMSDALLSGYFPDWLGDFRMLKYLYLDYNSLSGPLPASIGRLSALEELYLSYNNIRVIIPPAIKNLASLNFLDLSFNWLLDGKIPAELGNLCKLQYLGLSSINISKNLHELDEVFTGCIKNSLETLSMQSNQLSGYLPDRLGEFRMLKFLFLGNNSISGPVPASLGRLSALQELDLHSNKLNGVMSKDHFANFTKLNYLDLSENQLTLNLGHDWIPSFQLQTLKLSSCKLGPQFPAWLRMLENISHLDIFSNGISDIMPDWFWRSFSKIAYLDISSNGIIGNVPDLTDFINLYYFNLSSNYFEGPLPNFNSSNMQHLDLSNNSFSGVIYSDIGKSMPNLDYLWLSKNSLSGEIPLSLCQLRNADLDLSKNQLLGELPNCWKHYSFLVFVIDFSSNNLSGSVPPSICSLPFLQSLHLSNNNLSGELPLSLKSCARLNTLDLGHNRFIGTIPTWIGESLMSLKILRLRSNMFVGNIPSNLSRLIALQILDLANNNLSGTIPSSFGNFTTMKVSGEMNGTILENHTSYHENMQVTIKGIDIEYAILLPLVIVMDLSDNNLSGKIPEELTNLLGLMSLNLSGNHLTGEITEKIGALQQLESLDLSRNNLSGGIPSSMIALTFLSYLNLSYNNLSGRVPSDNQFQTFTDLSIYAGNPDLCGFPLTQKCKDDWTNQGQNVVGGDEQNDNAMDEEGSKMKWLNMSTGAGFAIGLWVVFGPLLFNKKWGEAYFQLIDQVYNMVYVVLAVMLTRFIKIVSR